MKNTIIKRLKNVAGQINGIVKMIENEKECIDIINQLKAAQAGLKKVNNLIAGESLTKCFGKKLSISDTEQMNKLIAELSN